MRTFCIHYAGAEISLMSECFEKSSPKQKRVVILLSQPLTFKNRLFVTVFIGFKGNYVYGVCFLPE